MGRFGGDEYAVAGERDCTNDTGERLRRSSEGVAILATNGTLLWGVGWMVDGEESTVVSTTGPKGLLCSINIMGAAGTIELEPSVFEPLRTEAIEPDLLLTERVFGLSLGFRTLPA